MELQTIMWATIKLVAFLFVAVLWVKLIQRRVVPYFKDQEGGSRRPFPYLYVGALIVLSAATLWFAQAELAYRQVWSTPDRTIDRERAAQPRTPEQIPEAKPARKESLEERTERMKREAEEQNERAKQKFSELKKPSSP